MKSDQDGAAGDGRAAEQLAQLRSMIERARSMPMSASCVVNRADALELIDQVTAALPEELGEARGVLDDSRSEIARAEAEGNRIIESARETAADLARHSTVVEQAEEQAARITAEARSEAEELRQETEAYIDERMAGFESVLHRTASQVKTYRARLAERGRPNDDD